MLYTPCELGKMIFKTKWQEPDHILLLDALLLKLALRKIHRLIVNLPPRYGKSMLTSILFPFWYIGNYPNQNLMLVTYQNKLAQLWGKRIRQLFFSYGESLFNVSLDKADRSASTMTVAQHNGKIICVGSGGLLTGLGADAIVVDDPIKNNKEALSFHQRDSLWEWFKATLFTRLEPNGILLIVSTRWHEDDIIGRILASNKFVEIRKDNIDNLEDENDAKTWFLLKLPAIAKENDPLGRRPGEPLWKERFDFDTLCEQRKVLGDFWFSALYQQEPIFSTGRIFKREKFRYFSLHDKTIVFPKFDKSGILNEHILLNDCSIFATFDLAVRTTERSDYTVALVFAVSRNKDIFILDVVREKFEATDHLNLILSVFSRWKPILVGIESVQYQFSLVQVVRKQGVPVKELKADRDKIARSLAIASWLDSGKVFFLKDAPWLGDFERELLDFPDGSHDDQVDAFAYITQLIEPLANARVHSISKRRAPEMLSLFE